MPNLFVSSCLIIYHWNLLRFFLDKHSLSRSLIFSVLHYLSIYRSQEREFPGFSFFSLAKTNQIPFQINKLWKFMKRGPWPILQLLLELTILSFLHHNYFNFPRFFFLNGWEISKSSERKSFHLMPTWFFKFFRKVWLFWTDIFFLCFPLFPVFQPADTLFTNKFYICTMRLILKFSFNYLPKSW